MDNRKRVCRFHINFITKSVWHRSIVNKILKHDKSILYELSNIFWILDSKSKQYFANKIWISLHSWRALCSVEVPEIRLSTYMLRIVMVLRGTYWRTLVLTIWCNLLLSMGMKWSHMLKRLIEHLVDLLDCSLPNINITQLTDCLHVSTISGIRTTLHSLNLI